MFYPFWLGSCRKIVNSFSFRPHMTRRLLTLPEQSYPIRWNSEFGAINWRWLISNRSTSMQILSRIGMIDLLKSTVISMLVRPLYSVRYVSDSMYLLFNKNLFFGWFDLRWLKIKCFTCYFTGRRNCWMYQNSVLNIEKAVYFCIFHILFILSVSRIVQVIYIIHYVVFWSMETKCSIYCFASPRRLPVV